MRQQIGEERPVHSALKVQEWTPHTDGECGVCSLFASQRKGGRPRSEGKNRGRPGIDSPQQTITEIHQRAPPSWRVSQPLSPSRFLPPGANISLADLLCPTCKCVVDRPVETPCCKLVCAMCMVRHIQDQPPGSCPCCDTEHDPSSSTIAPASDVVMKVLGTLLIRCDQPSCTEVVELQNLRLHVKCGCKRQMLPYSPSKLTVGQLLACPLEAPPSSTEQRAATSIVKRMMYISSEESRVVKLPTAGSVSSI